MFGKKKNADKKTVVTSQGELKAAVKRKDPYIEIQGDLVKKMKWMGKLSKKKITALTTLLGAATVSATATVASPLTAPASLVAFATTSTAAVILDIATASFIIALGVTTVIAVFNDYTIEVQAGDTSLKLIKK